MKSQKSFKKKYYRNRVIESYFIDPDADKSDDEEENVNRRRIAFRFENNEVNEIPRNRENYDNPFISDISSYNIYFLPAHKNREAKFFQFFFN